MCIVPPYGGNVGVWINDRRALVNSPGFLTWPGGLWTKDLPQGLLPDIQEDEHYKWHLLSTVRPNPGAPGVPHPKRSARAAPWRFG